MNAEWKDLPDCEGYWWFHVEGLKPELVKVEDPFEDGCLIASRFRKWPMYAVDGLGPAKWIKTDITPPAKS